MTAGWRRLVGPVVGAVILAAVLRLTGTGPVADGIRALDGRTLAMGALVALVTTVASAWRWRLVAGGLGVGLDLGTAITSCYRSQLLNVVVPGGVVGDVHRGLRHGRAAGTTGLALRAVAWERLSGQVVQAALALVALVLLPSPVRGHLPEAAGVLVLGAAGVLVLGAAGALLLWRTTALAPTPLVRLRRSVQTDVRRGLLARGVWPGVVLASTVAVTGYVATYLLAARAVGVTSPPERLVPLALLVLLAAGLPFNVAGWGPREGMAAWAFGAAGLGAAQGVATAVAYGALVLVGTLPGAVVLAFATRGSQHPGTVPPSSPPSPSSPLPALGAGGAGG